MLNQFLNTLGEFFSANATTPEVQQAQVTCQAQTVNCDKLFLGIIIPVGAAMTAALGFMCYETFRKKTDAELFAEAKARVALATYTAFVNEDDLKLVIQKCEHEKSDARSSSTPAKKMQ